MKLLITCTNPRAAEFADDLKSLYGIEAIPLPALTVEPLNTARPVGDFEAMLITSRHAVTPALPDLPVIAVGAKTAQAAKQAGFTVIKTGQGGVRDLDLSPYQSLLYPCAAQPRLIPDRAMPWPVYETHPYSDFHIPYDITHIAVFSVKGALEILKHHPSQNIKFFCLSPAIAEVFGDRNPENIAICGNLRYNDMINLIGNGG